MAFLAFGAADILDGDTVESFKSFVNAVEVVTMAGGVGEVDFCGAVAVDAPAHAEGSELADLVHVLDGAVAGLALDFACADVLGMVEIDMIGEGVDADPLDGVAGLRVASLPGVVAGVAVEFLYFFVGVHA